MFEKKEPTRHVGSKYEVIFSIFLIVLAFLYRDNAHLIYPQVLYWLSLFLFLNLAVGFFLRAWPTREWVASLITMANCGVITAILSTSGGPESNLWILYLLPVFNVCLFLRGRDVVWITIGVIAFNVALYFHKGFAGSWDANAFFNLGIRAGLFVFAAAVVWRMALKNRSAQEKMEAQRKKMRDLEESIDQQKSQAQRLEKMADMGQLTSGVTHDLNNPLTVIFGTVKLLLEDLPSYPQIKPDLERILRSTELCKTIVSNLLSFARNQSLEQTPCQVHDVLDASISLYESTLNRKGIKVERKFSEELPDIQASVSQLQRVFLNLMANAKSVLTSGGKIFIRTERVSSPQKGGPDWIQITVEDTGPGIPESVLANIFKPFNSTKAPGEGTGLGLYLAKEIVSQHGGLLRAQNRPEGGARFVIALPASANIPQAALAASSAR